MEIYVLCLLSLLSEKEKRLSEADVKINELEKQLDGYNALMKDSIYDIDMMNRYLDYATVNAI